MRRLMNLLVWVLLAGGSLATAQWAGQDPEAPSSVLTVNGQPLPVPPGGGRSHDPRTCRSCNVGTQPRGGVAIR